MKLLRNRPPIPPFLFVGSGLIAAPLDLSLDAPCDRQVLKTWQRIAVDVAADDHCFRAVLRRLDARSKDPAYTDDPAEVYYRITDVGEGQMLVIFYL